MSRSAATFKHHTPLSLMGYHQLVFGIHLQVTGEDHVTSFLRLKTNKQRALWSLPSLDEHQPSKGCPEVLNY